MREVFLSRYNRFGGVSRIMNERDSSLELASRLRWKAALEQSWKTVFPKRDNWSVCVINEN